MISSRSQPPMTSHAVPLQVAQSGAQWRWGDMEWNSKNSGENPEIHPTQVGSASPSTRSIAQVYKGKVLMSPPMMLRVPEAVSTNALLESAQSHTARFGNSASNRLDCGVLDVDGGAISPQPHSEPQSSQESPNPEPAPEPMQASVDTANLINVACSIAVQSMINTASAHINGPSKLDTLDTEEAAAALCQAQELQEQYYVKHELNIARTQAKAPLVEWTHMKMCAPTSLVDNRQSHSPSRCATSGSRYAAAASGQLSSIPLRRPASQASSRLSSHSPKSSPPSRQWSRASSCLSNQSSGSPSRIPSASPSQAQPASRANNRGASRSPIGDNSPAARVKSSAATPNRQRVVSTNTAMRHLAGFGFRPPRPVAAKAADVVQVVTISDLQGKNRIDNSPAKTRIAGRQQVGAPSDASRQSTPRACRRSASAMQHPNLHSGNNGLAVEPRNSVIARRSSAPARSAARVSAPSYRAPARSNTQPLHIKADSGSSKSPQPRRQSISPARQSSLSPGPSGAKTPPRCKSHSKSPGPSRSNTPPSRPTRSITPPSRQFNSKSSGPSRVHTPPSRQSSGKTTPFVGACSGRSSTPPSHQQASGHGHERRSCHARSRSPVMRSTPDVVERRTSTTPSTRAEQSSSGTPRESVNSVLRTHASPRARPATPMVSRVDSRLIEVVNDLLRPPQPLQTRSAGEQDQVTEAAQAVAQQTTSVELTYDQMCLQEPIGSGSFGTVWRGSYEGEVVAVKQCLINDARDKETLRGELRCLRRFSHPRLVSFLGCCSQGTNFFILMEFMSGGSLHELLFKKQCKLEFPEQARMSGEVCQGLSYLHNLGVVHRDLKTMNIVLDDLWRCKICDFGLTLMLEKSHCTVRALQGSPRYMAPEQFEAVVKITNKVDIWQFGCVLLELCCRHVPFSNCAGIQQIATELLVRRKPPAIPSEADPRARVVISACLRMRPHMRPTSEALEKAFEKLCA